jgi:hypothetical protein
MPKLKVKMDVLSHKGDGFGDLPLQNKKLTTSKR